MLVRGWLTAVCVLVAAIAPAQDVHFSQMDFNPLLLNASYAGFSDGGGRLGAAYRTQWASVSQPFRTFAFTADAQVWHDRYRRNGLGVGAVFYRDKAGTLNYGTTSASAMLSYSRALDWDGVNHLAVGVELGWNLLGYDVSQATLYDETEPLDEHQLQYPTVGCGLAWSCEPDDRWRLRVGLAAHNLNRPLLSRLGDADDRLETRWLASARLGWQLSEHWELSPILLTQLQHGHSELCYGTDVRWSLGNDDHRHLILAAGAVLRQGDACILSVSAEYNSLQVIFCYDANTSALSEASSGYGAVELGVGYRFVKQKKQRRKALPCPIM